ncbi:Ig-like domain-containing protein [Planctomyces sp. SH-PL62]|uniref:Ig-like domain-containing protein n=1 Tax=Planctomyces sp. SH-PL62 TaxID=1636152 RepID=UPI0012E8B404|nr:Ig-like domain-containing protein [Planctomyces sp. SH-PL62]
MLATTGPFYFQAELAATPPPQNAALAGSVAISQDGLTIAATSDSRVGDPGPGSVTVFTKQDGVWAGEAVLAPPELEGGPWHTDTVAMSADGDRLVFAISTESVRGPLVMSVYDRSGGEWTSTQTITIPDSGFHRALAMSGDGRVIAVGLPSGGSEDPNARGLVRTFEESGGTWSSTAELRFPEESRGDGMGTSVSLSGDGRTLAVGVRNPPDASGSVLLFEDGDAGWGLASRIGTSERYWDGPKTALSADGDHLLVGGVQIDEDVQRVYSRAFAYARDESGWVAEGAFVGVEEDAGGLPLALAIDADGTRAVIGVDGRGFIPGSAFVYARTGSNWGRIDELADPEAFVGSRFGASVAIGGGSVVVGDPTKDNPAGGGAAFVFREPQGFEVVTDPVDQLGRPLSTVTFTAAAGGAEGITAQWQVSADGGATWTDVPQARGLSLAVVPTLADSGKQYRAVFTDGGGATVVSRAATLTVAEATPLITIEVSDDHVFFYEPMTITVRLHSDGSTPRVPDGGAVEVGMQLFKQTVRVYNGVATLTIPANVFRPGIYTITATYDGAADPVFGSGFGYTTQVIQKAFVKVETQPLATRPVVGRPVDLSAIISQVEPDLLDGTGPTGYALFYGLGDGLGAAFLERPPHPPVLPSTVTYTATFTRPGDYAVVVYYAGDDWNEPLASGNFFITVDPAPTSIQLDPSGTQYADYGEAVFYTVTVTTDDLRPAPGFVSVRSPFYTGPGEFALDAQGRARIPIQGLPAGGRSVTFTYTDPDGLHASREITAAIGVYKAPTTVTLETARPSVAEGDMALVTATVRYASSDFAPASGFVELYVGSRLTGRYALGPGGRVSVPTYYLAAWSYTLTAVFVESGNLQGSVSNQVVQQVTPRPAPPTEAATAVAVWSTASPIRAGQALEFVAQVGGVVGGSGSPRPTSGLVRFYLGLKPIAERPIDADGRATLAARFDAPGEYLITAVFLGGGGFPTGQSNHLRQLVLADPIPASGGPSGQAAPPSPRRDQSLAAAEMRRTAFATARAERLARLALRRPPALRSARP